MPRRKIDPDFVGPLPKRRKKVPPPPEPPKEAPPEPPAATPATPPPVTPPASQPALTKDQQQLQRMKDDFVAFLFVLWRALGLPKPTKCQIDMARKLSAGNTRRFILQGSRQFAIQKLQPDTGLLGELAAALEEVPELTDEEQVRH